MFWEAGPHRPLTFTVRTLAAATAKDEESAAWVNEVGKVSRGYESIAWRAARVR